MNILCPSTSAAYALSTNRDALQTCDARPDTTTGSCRFRNLRRNLVRNNNNQQMMPPMGFNPYGQMDPLLMGMGGMPMNPGKN